MKSKAPTVLVGYFFIPSNFHGYSIIGPKIHRNLKIVNVASARGRQYLPGVINTLLERFCDYMYEIRVVKPCGETPDGAFIPSQELPLTTRSPAMKDFLTAHEVTNYSSSHVSRSNNRQVATFISIVALALLFNDCALPQKIPVGYFDAENPGTGYVPPKEYKSLFYQALCQGYYYNVSVILDVLRSNGVRVDPTANVSPASVFQESMKRFVK